jgi:hypothetical protein
MGTELVGRPQLYSTIAVDGGLAAYTIRQIILGAQLASGRYFVKLSDVYNLNSDELADTEQRKAFLDLLFKPR